MSNKNNIVFTFEYDKETNKIIQKQKTFLIHEDKQEASALKAEVSSLKSSLSQARIEQRLAANEIIQEDKRIRNLLITKEETQIKSERKDETSFAAFIRKRTRRILPFSEESSSHKRNDQEETTINNLVDLDSSSDRAAIRFIKNLRKSRIKSEKEEYKNRIRLAETAEEKTQLRNELKDKIKHGVHPNEEGYIIELNNVNKYYFTSGRYERILKDIDLKIPTGKFVIILGPSGTGKTTLLNIVSGLDFVNSGDVVVADTNLFYLDDNKRIKFRADNLSFVFQSYNLISTLTVEENIKIGENLRASDADEIPIKDILEQLGLSEQAKKYPYQLSGGQQQRVSIARALAKNPRILFADEPTGALDEERGRETLKLLMDINQKYKTTLIVVTHNPNLEAISDIVIKVKDGRIDKYIENKNKVTDVTQIKWG